MLSPAGAESPTPVVTVQLVRFAVRTTSVIRSAFSSSVFDEQRATLILPGFKNLQQIEELRQQLLGYVSLS